MAANVGRGHARSAGVVVLSIAPVCFDASKAQWPLELAYALGREWTLVGIQCDVLVDVGVK